LGQVDAAKAALAQGKKRVLLRVRVEGKVLEEALDYETIRVIGDDILGSLEALTTQVLGEAAVTWNELDHVLLAGSAVRLPFVQEAVKRWSGNREVFSLAGPEVASGGAALVAESSVRTRNSTLDFRTQEVLSHSYAIRCTDLKTGEATTEIVVSKNSPLPTAVRTHVSKRETRQTEIKFQILELENSDLESAVVLGEATISNLPPGLPVGAPVEVELSFDAGGVLSLFVYSLSTGRRQAPEYRPANRMTLAERTRWRSWLEKLHQQA
jgi:molecular chaperone DnaK (HSP70)